MITIDHIDKIDIDPNKHHVQNNHALSYLHDGLLLLANNVKQIEQEYQKTLMGKAILALPLNSGESRILACFFHWFGISAVSYVKLIALLDIMQKNDWIMSDLKDHKEEIKKHGTNYAEKVIPEVLHWRNKIAAHLAAFDPFNDDNTAMLQMSLINPVSWENPHYYVGSFQYGISNELSSLKKWSIVEIFEKLIPRYWPHIVVDKQ